MRPDEAELLRLLVVRWRHDVETMSGRGAVAISHYKTQLLICARDLEDELRAMRLDG